MWKVRGGVVNAIRRKLHAGKKLRKWKVKIAVPISEFNLIASELQHENGCKLLHIDRPDANATFAVGFRTLPKDSTGLPHILEHTALCGSEKFPCRDPFFNMLNRSLATFMNASTAPDFTVYPFSTQNEKDFANLQSVYLDAAFRPRLSEYDFKQEGWRLEHSDPKDQSTPIVIKGVVYNEMKGVFSDSQNLFGESLLNNLLPSHTYGVCSGGEPLEIPNLRHIDLVNFHSKFYNASNAHFFMYGSLPLEKHIDSLDSYIDGKPSPSEEVPPEPRWTSPRRKHINSRIDSFAADEKKQGTISVSFLCCDIRDIEETFVLTVLSQLLVDGPNAPFYRTLIEPGIGAGLSPFTGYESSTRDTFFSVGLQGVAPEDFDKIEGIINNTLEEVAKNGFKAAHVEAVLHGIELGLKHQSSNFGLRLLYSISSLWMNGGDVIGALQIEQKIARLRKNLKEDPTYLQKKVEQYLLRNSHRLTLTMAPVPNYEEEMRKKEEELLAKKLAEITEEEKKKIYSDGLELLEKMKESNKDVLPTLHPSDIPKDIVKVPVENRKLAGVPVSIFNQPTNGITYFRALLQTDEFPKQLQPFLPIFSHVATRMGTKKRTFRELDEIISLKTGGLDMSNHLTENVKSSGYESSLFLGSHCLDRNIPHMFDLWKEVLAELDLSDGNRYSALLRSLAADSVNSIPGAGHHYAMLSAASLVSDAARKKEQNGGMSYVSQLKELAGGDAQSGLQQIQELATHLTNSKIRCSITALPGTDLQNLSQMLENLKLRAGECSFSNEERHSGQHGLFHVLPFDVSYAGKAVPTVPYSHPDFAPLRVFTKYLSRKYLHPEIREKGGAYGCGVSISTSGIVNFYSYRDPLPHRTLQTFDKSFDWLLDNVPTELDLDEAKLGVFQQVDAPVAPGDRGGLLFMHGVTDEMLQEHRERLKAVKVEDVVRAVETYLKSPTTVGRCVIGPKNEDILKDSMCNWKSVDG